MGKGGQTADASLDPAIILGNRAMQAGITKLLDRLAMEPVVKRVLTLRYGLDGGDKRSLEVVGLMLEISEEQAEQHLQVGLDACRVPAVQRQLRDLTAA